MHIFSLMLRLLVAPTAIQSIHTLGRKRFLLGLVLLLVTTQCRSGTVRIPQNNEGTVQSDTSEAGNNSVNANDLMSKAGCWSVSTTYTAGDKPSGTLKKTSNLTGTVPTHKWWESALWDYPSAESPNVAKPFSMALYALPLSARTQAEGLGISYVDTAVISDDKVSYTYALPVSPAVVDLIVGIAGMKATSSVVDAASDWSVTLKWPQTNMSATLVKGSPFAFFETQTDGISINVTGNPGSNPNIWANERGALGITVGTRHYALFGPLESNWKTSTDARTLTNSLSGKGYLSLAALPQADVTILRDFQTHAYAFVTDTSVRWSYNPELSTVATTYTEQTTLKEPSMSNVPMMALLPHHAQYTQATKTNYTYNSPRGPLVLIASNNFTTHMTYHGTLPALPAVGDFDPNRLTAYLQAETLTINMGNTYDSGVSLNKYAHLFMLADALGLSTQRDTIMQSVKSSLTDWFTATADSTPLFAYNPNWTTLVGFPAGYGSDTQLNDHHFHWGYLIKVAAFLGLYDNAWLQDTGYGGILKALIRDSANPVRTDKHFPFLRQFDIYEGHSWASGHSSFEAGNNQESSSESMNFSSALILYGEMTQNQTIRDLGIYLYTTEAEAIAQYWFDVEQKNFPAGSTHPAYTIIWGNGGTYATWFTAAPEAIAAIEFLPFTGGSLYLGLNPNALSRNYDAMVKQINGLEGTSGLPGAWVDLIWQMQAFYDPNVAISKFESQASTYEPEQGESRAHTYHWLYALKELGSIDASITANTPLYSVFIQNNVRTYVAFNADCARSKTVLFSDQTSFEIAPNTLVAYRQDKVFKTSLVGANACSSSPTPACTIQTSAFNQYNL